jgi:hypothetical protein
LLTVRFLTLNKYGCPTQLTAVGIRKDLWNHIYRTIIDNFCQCNI